MKTYSDVVDRVFLQEDLLKKLIPTEPLTYELVRRIQSAEDPAIAGERPIKNAEMFALVRGGLLYAVDGIHEAHTIFQDAKGDLGSYWHGMMHRREGDFDNARYWFRRSGTRPGVGPTSRRMRRSPRRPRSSPTGGAGRSSTAWTLRRSTAPAGFPRSSRRRDISVGCSR